MVGMILEGEVLSAQRHPAGAERRGNHRFTCWGDLRTIASGVGVAEPISVSVLVRD